MAGAWMRRLWGTLGSLVVVAALAPVALAAMPGDFGDEPNSLWDVGFEPTARLPIPPVDPQALVPDAWSFSRRTTIDRYGFIDLMSCTEFATFLAFAQLPAVIDAYDGAAADEPFVSFAYFDFGDRSVAERRLAHIEDPAEACAGTPYGSDARQGTRIELGGPPGVRVVGYRERTSITATVVDDLGRAVVIDGARIDDRNLQGFVADAAAHLRALDERGPVATTLPPTPPVVSSDVDMDGEAPPADPAERLADTPMTTEPHAPPPVMSPGFTARQPADWLVLGERWSLTDRFETEFWLAATFDCDAAVELARFRRWPALVDLFWHDDLDVRVEVSVVETAGPATAAELAAAVGALHRCDEFDDVGGLRAIDGGYIVDGSSALTAVSGRGDDRAIVLRFDGAVGAEVVRQVTTAAAQALVR